MISRQQQDERKSYKNKKKKSIGFISEETMMHNVMQFKNMHKLEYINQ